MTDFSLKIRQTSLDSPCIENAQPALLSTNEFTQTFIRLAQKILTTRFPRDNRQLDVRETVYARHFFNGALQLLFRRLNFLTPYVNGDDTDVP
jgi:hypothetical protein